MAVSIAKSKKAHELLEKYEGSNPYLKLIKYYTFVKKDRTLSDLDIDYIICNHEFIPKPINKIVKLADWFSEKKQKDWGTKFLPQKIQITHLLGETDKTYHVYLNYQQKQEKPVMCFIPKNALLDDFLADDFNNLEIDFTKYDEMLSKFDMKLYEHQKSAVKFLSARKKAILADQPGLGKSLSINVLTHYLNFKKVLIICPASIKSNWKRELKILSPEEDIAIINADNWISGKRYTIINYDIIDRHYKVAKEIDENGKSKKTRKKAIIDQCLSESNIYNENFDAIIIDEAHKLSNNTSIRYETIHDYIKKSKIENIYLMTGTPITNRPMNFFNLITLIDHQLSKNWEYYVKRYCDGKQITIKKTGKKIWITDGASNLDELKEKVKDCYIRRSKDDIPGMVARTVIEKYYELNKEQRIEYEKLWEEYEESQLLLGKTNLNKDLTEGIILRSKISQYMIPNTIQLANEILEDGEKVFIGCLFNEEVYKFKEYYGDKAVIYNGSMTAKQKDSSEDKFMNDPKVKVLIGNINASGVGINLVVASKVIVNSCPYVPGDLEQLIDRVHRLTQKEDVYAYIQLFTNTISEDIWNTVMRKDKTIKKIIKKEDDK